MINLLHNTPNQPSKFKSRNWVELNDYSCTTYNINSQIKFKTMMLKTSLGDYSDACILVSKPITITGARKDEAAIAADRNNKQYLKIVHHLPTA